MDSSAPTIIAAQGSSPKHAIYHFIIYSQFCAMLFFSKNQKEAGFGQEKWMFGLSRNNLQVKSFLLYLKNTSFEVPCSIEHTAQLNPSLHKHYPVTSILNPFLKYLPIILRPVWPDLAKFRHFGKLFKVLGNSEGFIYFLAKFWNYFGIFCVPLANLRSCQW